ncbi:MAG: hypothetical protein ABI390_04565 [Daejeonella sp.]
MKPHLLLRKIVAYILLFSCVNLFFSCHRFYRPVGVNTSNVENKQSTLKQLAQEDRYFILRKGTDSYSLNNLVFDQTAMTLTANLGGVPLEHQRYAKLRKNRYTYSKAKKEDVVLKEVHLYISDTLRIDTTRQYTLALADIQKIEVIEFNKLRTSSSYTLGTLGIGLGAVLVAAVIAAATYQEPEPGSSCPYISVYDGEGYVLQGELYGGAIFPQLQRDDYLPLQLPLANSTFTLKISNELPEIQHTDFLDLLVVEHEPHQKMLIDPEGQVHSISKPLKPTGAILNKQQDVMSLVLIKDNKSCLFNDPNSLNNSEDLFLNFKNDQKSIKAKLVLNLKSSSWFDNLYGEFTSGFGSYYPIWIKKQEKVPAGKLQKWINEQNIPLTISVKTGEGWKEVKKLNTIGPLLNREIVIPLELPANEQAEVRLSCGYLFWELDYVAIDYSEDEAFKISRIKPYQAINEHQLNVLPAILHADKKFLDQPNIGDATILKYKNKAAADGKVQTVFLHSSGYYEHVRSYKGTPKTAFLKSFKKPGAFAAYSKQRFSESWNTLLSAQK